jgi:hypothetical protein
LVFAEKLYVKLEDIMLLRIQMMTETQNTTATEKLRKASKPLIMWIAIFLVLVFIANVVVYSGFFVGVPSSATSLNNYDNFEKGSTWSNFKTAYPALDPQNMIYGNYGVTISVTGMNALEDFTRPKDFLLFHVEINAYQQGYWLKLPSVLVLLLDQTDRIRGKLYVQQGSGDFFLTAFGKAEYTFWYHIPSDMRGQNFRIVVELFGVMDNTQSVDYSKIQSTQVNPQPFSVVDGYYGNLPSWYYKNDSLTSTYRYFTFIAFNDFEGTMPQFISIPSLALYAWTITGIVAVFSTLIVFARQWMKSYWERNKVAVSFAILFLVFLIIFFIIMVLTH